MFVAGEGLKRTRAVLNTDISDLVRGRKRIDQELLDELETRLITADVGVAAATRIIDDMSARVKRHELSDPAVLMSALKEELAQILRACDTAVRVPAAGRPGSSPARPGRWRRRRRRPRRRWRCPAAGTPRPGRSGTGRRSC